MGAKSGRFGSVSAPTSDLSSSSSDSDPDILPSAQSAIDLTSKNPGGGGAGTEGGSDRVFANGKWFTVLDETYLLPVFSNATASRKQSAKKAMLKAKRSSFAVDRSSEDLGGDDSFDGGNGSPYLGTGSNHQVNPSFSVRRISFRRASVMVAHELLYCSAGHPLFPRCAGALFPHSPRFIIRSFPSFRISASSPETTRLAHVPFDRPRPQPFFILCPRLSELSHAFTGHFSCSIIDCSGSQQWRRSCE